MCRTLAVVLAASSALAAEPSSWAVVLVSKESPDAAQQALGALGPAAAKWVKPAAGYPKVVESGSVKGFKPGYHVVVLGYCADKAEAAAAASYVRLDAPEAYFKQVNV